MKNGKTMTKPVSVDFIYDFGSLNAYLVHKVLPDISERTGIEFNYKPILLGGVFKLTNNQSPMMAFSGVKGKLDYQMLEIKRFVAQHKLTEFHMNEHFPINTLMLMRGAILAETENCSTSYNEMAFKAIWEENLKMDDPQIFADRLTADGFGFFLDRISSPDVKAELMRVTQQAVDRGVFGAPSFFVGDEMFFGKDRLLQVEAEINRQAV